MGRKVRKQIYLEPEQDARLKQRAKELGISEAELIRRGIAQVCGRPVTPSFDEKAWEEEMAFIRERMQMDVPQTGRTWTREELYDERLERYSR